MSRILIAEDEPDIASFIEQGLRGAGHSTTITTDGLSARDLAASGAFALMVLDLGLPEMDGIDVLAELREQGSTMPVIVLTARDTVGSTVEALDGGANDYMTKPFQVGELLARIRLRLRESEPSRRAESAELAVGDLVLDLHTHRVTTPEGEWDLTSREFTLLEAMMEHPGRVMSRAHLLREVWGMDFDPGSNVVDVFIRTLRRKIGARYIETVRGSGYRVPRP